MSEIASGILEPKRGVEMEIINGILFLYHHPLKNDASTISEHISSFRKYSNFKVFSLNIEFGFPEFLASFSFKIIVLHYSLFRSYLFINIEEFLESQRKAYTIAFFQDEYHFCKERFELINHYGVDCVYTLIEPRYHEEIYKKNSTVKKVIYCLPGYVDDEMIEAAHQCSLPDEARSIDIGYRGRQLPYYMGAGSQEKSQIADKFLATVNVSSLILDIKTKESDRLYGKNWFTFLGNCKGILGVEAGVSIFDIDGTVYRNYLELMEKLNCNEVYLQSHYSFKEISDMLSLQDFEDNIYYRTISPRIFEAAAFRICQILFEGDYSGILKPWVHYLPLKKDFSNINEILECFNEPTTRSMIVENAYRDIIQSGKYSYKSFIASFDDELIKIGFFPNLAENIANNIDSIIARWEKKAKVKRIICLQIDRIYGFLLSYFPKFLYR